MIDDKDFSNQISGRKLTDVFKELEQARKQYENENLMEQARKNEKSTIKAKKTNFSPKTNQIMQNGFFEKQENTTVENNFSSNNSRKLKKPFTYKKAISISSIILFILILVAVLVVSFSNSILAKNSLASSDVTTYDNTKLDIEINRHRLNAHNLITANAASETIKEQVVEVRDIPYEIVRQEANYLPKGEEKTVQEGAVGKKNVTVVKTYENGEFVEENILNEEKIQDYLPQIITVGTSDFLYKIQAHIGDTLYLNKNSVLRENPDKTSTEVAEIEAYLDVKLLELPSEEWCKVSYDSIEGYLPSDVLTSAKVTPNIVNKNRIKKILDKVDINMFLNTPSGLTLADFENVFKNLPQDVNNIFEENAKVFYKVEQKYNINGIFLASLGIHESQWGTSEISKDKKNLFGYGAYDSTPYESSYEFETYEEGIDLVARVLTKYYLNPAGTKIYNNETAVATYYNGSRLEDVNKRYASDEDWHEKVYKYMEYLYNRLK